MIRDIWKSIRSPGYWAYSTWMKFALKYRKTTLGPVWVLVSPALFVFFLGFMFARVNTVSQDIFIPHLAVGYITWLVIGTLINQGAALFVSRRQELLQGRVVVTDIVFSSVFLIFLQYFQQSLIFIFVLWYFQVWSGLYCLVSLIGVLFLFINGIWVTVFFGILGARYRDLKEMIDAVTRLAFFITPIIWIPKDGQGGVLGAFLVYNPFYHFLELVRAPLLGNPIMPISWLVVTSITVIGLTISMFLYNRTVRFLPIWA